MLRGRIDWWKVAFYAGYIAALEAVDSLLAGLSDERQVSIEGLRILLEDMALDARQQLGEACIDRTALGHALNTTFPTKAKAASP